MKKASAILASLCWLAACATPPDVQRAPDFRMSGDRIFLPAAVNGHPVEALLDSGAEMTLVDDAFAEEIGLVGAGQEEVRGTGAGTQDVQFAEGVEVAAAGSVLPDQVVVIIDLADVSRRLIGEPLRAVVGRELFDGGRYLLDVDAGLFRKVSQDIQPGGIELPLSDANGIKQVPVRINGGEAVKADFDLGNGSEILLSRDFAERTGLLAEGNIVGSKQGGGIGGPVEHTLVRVKTLSLGGVDLHDLVAAVGESSDAADVNIGTSVWREFRLVIDFPQNKVWLEPLS
ncbi:MAG TPA: pepsin/retropepsin-like aspartic protease family protein [Hyphomonas sp.]|nr:pepsin/retropepsin-like aspartic protease family protein [Hyphomonas sp.]HRX73051.1 pepsin/retropepsin-like aspartic protease family protein [Hyphomonas sp.]